MTQVAYAVEATTGPYSKEAFAFIAAQTSLGYFNRVASKLVGIN